MDGENRLGEFLRARREAVKPSDVGLPDNGRRRVAGLRREELAMLAGVSLDYYVRLEQGRDRHPSPEILAALGQVLRLDEVTVRHLDTLARPSGPPARKTRSRDSKAAPALERLLALWPKTPAVVVGPCFDVLAYNPLLAALYEDTSFPDNLVRAVFLDPAMRERYADWNRVADETVGSLRAFDNDRDRPRLTELVGELSVASEDFRRRWARHDVREKTSGLKDFIHPAVGALTLSYETFAVTGTAGQLLFVYHAEPGSDAARALDRLGELVATRGAPIVVDSAANGP